MPETRDPLRLEDSTRPDGLRIVRQPPPVGAASCAFTYVGPAGWGFDPAGREGTARMVNQVMASATRRLDRVELARRLDQMGATLAARCAAESGELTISGPSGEWRRLLDLLADVVQRPRFDATDLARAKRQIHERQLREMSQPGSRADRELLRGIFPRGHPYGSSGIGTEATTARVDRSTMVRFHRTQYSSGDAVLIATTAVSISSIESAARRSWGEFSTRRPPGLAFPHDRPRSARELRVDLPGRSQVEIRVGGASIGRRSADFPAAYLANEILGGRPLLSRLFQRIRERAGLVYGATSALESMRYGGYWYAQAGTGAERWRRVVPLLRAEIARMARRVVGVRELATIRESTIGEIPLALDTTSEAHELAVDVAYHDLPLDYWARWPDALREVTNSQIRDVARAAMDARHSVTVIAGPLGPAK